MVLLAAPTPGALRTVSHDSPLRNISDPLARLPGPLVFVVAPPHEWWVILAPTAPDLVDQHAHLGVVEESG